MSDTLFRYPEVRNHDLIEPRWWTGSPAVDPASYRVDRTDFAMDASDLDPDGSLARRAPPLLPCPPVRSP